MDTLRGIPGWDKVDRLAAELVSQHASGYSVPTPEVDRIVKLWNDLEEYDKRPLTYKSVVRRPSSGRFARSKHRSEHVGVEAVGR